MSPKDEPMSKIDNYDLDKVLSPRYREPNFLFNSFSMGIKWDLDTGDIKYDIYDLTRVKMMGQNWPDLSRSILINNIRDSYDRYEVVKPPSLFKKIWDWRFA